MKILKNCVRGILAGAMLMVLAGCSPSLEESAIDVGIAMKAALPAEFAELVFEAPAPMSGEPAPALVFQGKGSTLLATTEPQLRGRVWKRVEIEGLARTKSGRFFTFTYMSAIHGLANNLFETSCTQKDCRQMGSGSVVTLQDAKRWFFHSDAFTPKRYREIFDEEAPPQRVAA